MAAKGKTRERILKAALALFNGEGEGQVSTVDIASALEISPGNLYYHFHGKEAIIEALFDGFEAEMRLILAAPLERAMSLDDAAIFFTIVFEEINDFRFFYLGMPQLLDRCPALRPKMLRLMTMKESAARALLDSLARDGVLAFAEVERDGLAARLAAHLTMWMPYQSVSARHSADRPRSATAALHEAAYVTLLQLAPYAADDRETFALLLAERFGARQAL